MPTCTGSGQCSLVADTAVWLHAPAYTLIVVCSSNVGTLICRALIETMSDHNVHTFISLAGPHGGQFGGGWGWMEMGGAGLE